MSNLRPLARVALDVLFCRPCKRCHVAFLYCRSREPGRRYCDDCAAPAQREREQKARKTYRDSAEGIEQHRDEEEERRERRQLESVGDRRLDVAEGQLQAVSTAVPYTRTGEENRDEPDRERGEQVEWLLVAWPELLEEARGLLGTQVDCPGCGRRGVVVRVVSLDDWRPEDGS